MTLAGLLLRKTVECAESQDEIDGMNADDRPVGEELREYAERGSVPGIVERRDNHARVGDIEVRVARGEAEPAVINRRRHWKEDHLGFRAVFKPHPGPEVDLRVPSIDMSAHAGTKQRVRGPALATIREGLAGEFGG